MIQYLLCQSYRDRPFPRWVTAAPSEVKSYRLMPLHQRRLSGGLFSFPPASGLDWTTFFKRRQNVDLQAARSGMERTLTHLPTKLRGYSGPYVSTPMTHCSRCTTFTGPFRRAIFLPAYLGIVRIAHPILRKTGTTKSVIPRLKTHGMVR